MITYVSIYSGWKRCFGILTSNNDSMLMTYLTAQNRIVTVHISGPGWIIGFAVTLMKFMAKVGIHATNIWGPTTSDCFLNSLQLVNWASGICRLEERKGAEHVEADINANTHIREGRDARFRTNNSYSRMW